MAPARRRLRPSRKPPGRLERPSSVAASRPVIAAEPSQPPVPICIAGMHRSGTSMVARLLHNCGLYLGEENELAPAKPDNPDGFWENLKFVDLNEEILELLGAGWDMPPPAFPADWQGHEDFQKLRVKAELVLARFRGHDPWGWKDPRNSVTLPFWRSVLPNLKVIICVRHPLEVALSLRRRNFLSYELSLTLWALYNRRALEDVPPQQRLVVHYDAFFRRPQAEVNRIIEFAGLNVGTAQLESALERIRPDLRHATFETCHLIDAELSPDTIRLYLSLTNEAGWRDGARELPSAQAIRTEPRLLGNGNGDSIVVHHAAPEITSSGKLNRSNFDLELLKREVAGARAELENRGERIAELERLIAGSSGDFANPQIESPSSPQDLERRDHQMTRLKTVIGEIEQTLNSAEAFVERYADAFNDLENLLPAEEGERPGADLESRRAALRHRVEHVLEVLAASKADAANMKSAFDGMARRAEEAEREREAMRIATAEMSERIEFLQRECDEQQKIADRLQDEMNERVGAATGRVDLVQRERDEYKKSMAQLRDQTSAVTQRAVAAERELKEIVARAAASTRALDTMTARAEAAERERDQANASVDSARRLMLSLHHELDAIHRSRLWRVGSAYWRVLKWLGRLPEPGPAPVPEVFEPDAQPPQPAGTPAPLPRMTTYGGSRNLMDPRRAIRYVRRAIAHKPDSGFAKQLERIVEEHERRFSGRPTILDWNTGADIVAHLPHDVVFSPSMDALSLPYLDKTVDIVFVPASRQSGNAEAERIARHAIVSVSQRRPRLSVEWLRATARKSLCASIVIPVFNHIAETEACLDAIERTLPADFCGEIIVVDDASTVDTPSRLRRRAAGNPRIRVFRNEQNSGFVDTCNRGAKAAEHDYLVFLNNDTVPQSRWLSALLETFNRYPEAGAVGGKLLYPDGRLQEAGGCIFNDGSGLNFGKFDSDASAPLYNFVREVDYCSGALLATPRKLFEEIGGFDPRFRPAYYEDADYCFSVRKRGHKVLYQPESTTLHVEGATSGTDLGSGMKRFQTVNRSAFLAKWADELSTRPAPPDQLNRAVLQKLASPEERRRILFINHTVPEYDREGGSRRLFHLIEFASEAGWAVSFMAPWVPWGERYERELQQMGVQTYRKGLAKLEGETRFETEADRLIATGQFDVVVISFWHIAETWAPRVRVLSPKSRILIDSIDLHFLRQARAVLRQSSGDGATLGTGYADEMRRELNVYAASDAVLTVSEKEAAIINDFASNPRLAVAVPETEPPFANVLPFDERAGVLFIGSFRHPPNIEAVTFLAENIIPRINPKLLEVHPVYIVGNGLDKNVETICAGIPNVRLVGWVPTLDDYLRHARVSVLPLLNGAGTKTKLIQALNAGTPSVSTRIGAEGLPISHGEHVLIADDPAEFAAHIEKLLTDRELWNRLASAGRKTIEQTHGRTVGQAKFVSLLGRVLA